MLKQTQHVNHNYLKGYGGNHKIVNSTCFSRWISVLYLKVVRHGKQAKKIVE